MHYENRQAPEGLNVTKHNPVLLFVKLLVLAVVIVSLIVVVLNLLGNRLGRMIPFSYEQTLMERVNHDFGGQVQSIEIEEYLNQLARKVGRHLPLPEGMDMKVHYNSEDVFNAYATLGGNVVFYRQILQKIPHENALAMIVAHELSHVLHRDPVAGLGGGLASTMALSALTGGAGSGAAASLLNKTGMLTQLKFSRDMERDADTAALAAIYKTYGHVEGADELFRILNIESSADQESWATGFVSTHPQDQQRIDAIYELARENEWPTQGFLTPLPASFDEWLSIQE